MWCWEPLKGCALGYQLMSRFEFGLREDGRTAGSVEPNNRTGSVKPNRVTSLFPSLRSIVLLLRRDDSVNTAFLSPLSICMSRSRIQIRKSSEHAIEMTIVFYVHLGKRMSPNMIQFADSQGTPAPHTPPSNLLISVMPLF
jgi:hypothetical protein